METVKPTAKHNICYTAAALISIKNTVYTGNPKYFYKDAKSGYFIIY